MAQLKGIFFLPDGLSSLFQIYPPEAAESKLRDFVNLSGGLCLEKEEYGNDELEKFAIPLIDFNYLVQHKITSFHKPTKDVRDYFKPDFIYDSYAKNEKMDLNVYKISKMESQGCLVIYDANSILTRQLNWNNLVTTSTDYSPTGEKEKSQEFERSNESQATPPPEVHLNSSQNSDHLPTSSSIAPEVVQESIFTDDRYADARTNQPESESGASSRQPPSSNFSSWRSRRKDSSSDASDKLENVRTNPEKSKRRNYKPEESLTILKYVCEHKLHGKVMGNQMWELMEVEKELFKSRTAQSMREHFRKVILPNLNKYNCSAEDKKLFDDGAKVREEGKRSPLCRKPKSKSRKSKKKTHT